MTGTDPDAPRGRAAGEDTDPDGATDAARLHSAVCRRGALVGADLPAEEMQKRMQEAIWGEDLSSIVPFSRLLPRVYSGAEALPETHYERVWSWVFADGSRYEVRADGPVWIGRALPPGVKMPEDRKGQERPGAAPTGSGGDPLPPIRVSESPWPVVMPAEEREVATALAAAVLPLYLGDWRPDPARLADEAVFVFRAICTALSKDPEDAEDPALRAVGERHRPAGATGAKAARAEVIWEAMDRYSLVGQDSIGGIRVLVDATARREGVEIIRYEIDGEAQSGIWTFGDGSVYEVRHVDPPTVGGDPWAPVWYGRDDSLAGPGRAGSGRRD